MKQLLVTVLLIIVCVETTFAGIRFAQIYDIHPFGGVVLAFIALGLAVCLAGFLWDCAGEITGG